MIDFDRKGRRYTINGEPVTSVTTAIGVLDKPALVGWAASQSASYAVNNWDRLSRLDIADRLERITKARFEKNRTATTKGTRIHALGEAVAHGKSVEVPDDLSRTAIEAYARLLDQWGMETVATELPLANGDYLYAGTADLVVESDRLGRVLLDTKTGKAIYPEVALQLAAYRHCTHQLQSVTSVGPRGGKREETRVELAPEIDRCMAIHVREDSVELRPVETGDDIWSMFLHLVELYDFWIRRTGFDFRKDESYAPPIGEPLYPEASNEQIAALP